MRFSLRTLLIAVTLLCLACGWWARNAALEQQFTEAIDRLQAQGIPVYFQDAESTTRHSPIREVRVDSRDCKWDGETADLLSRLTNVETLSLSGMLLTQEQRHVLTNLPRLKAIDVQQCALSRVDIDAIVSNATELTSLEVFGSRVELTGLPQIMRIGRLTTLDFEDVLTEEPMPEVIEYPANTTVRCMTIGENTSIRVNAMPCVEEMYLSCGNQQVGKWGFVALATCSRLKKLRINIHGSLPREDSLLEIADQPALVEFTLRNGALSPIGVHNLSKMQSLRSVSLFSPTMSEDTVSAFEQLDQIDQLRIEWPTIETPRMTAAEMVSASDATLEEADAELARIKPELPRWAILKGCTRLQKLNVSVILNSPDELEFLYEMKNLKSLNLLYVTSA